MPGHTSPAQVRLARKLAGLMPGELECSYLACTGSEATEVALRLAKLVTGRSEIVALARGYHGMTHGSLAVTGLGGGFKGGRGTGLPGTTFIPAPYAYRNPYRDAADGDGRLSSASAACSSRRRPTCRRSAAGATRPAR